ncbi:MAG: four helix bundle protein [Gracilibacteraceae bacterium]|nr:four helix bundle protein [Gracilibacteraceae bacterium]
MTTREFVQFLKIARGSRAELETQLLICVRLKYFDRYGYRLANRRGASDEGQLVY